MSPQSPPVTAAILGLLALSGLANAQQTSSRRSAPQGPGSQQPLTTITLMHFNDLHAHMNEHVDLHEVGGTKVLAQRGGLARLKTIVDGVRNSNPNSLLFNVGDTYHGGVEAFYSEGNDIVAAVNAIGFDVGVPGNWDFGFGPIVARKRFTNDPTPPNPSGQAIAKPNFPHLAGNVIYASPVFPFNLAGSPFLPARTTFTLDGIKIGIIGITSDIVPRMHPQLAQGLSFLEGRTAYLNLINQQATALRNQGSRLVVVLSELGMHKDLELADSLAPGKVDVFFSAHTHELTRTPLNSQSGALVVEAGNDTWLGRMDVRFSATQLVDFSWSLIPITHDIPENAVVKALVDGARAPYLANNPNLTAPSPGSDQTLTQPIDTVLGITNTLLDRRHALENSFNDSFTETLRNVAGTDLAMAPGFRFESVNPGMGTFLEDNTIASGEITLEDVYRFIPVGYTLASGTITGQQLRAIIEGNATSAFSDAAFEHSGGWLDGFSGLELGLDLNGVDGAKVQSLKHSMSGTPIGPNDQLSIAGCSRPFDQNSATNLCSYEGFTGVTPLVSPTTGQAWTSIDFLAETLSSGSFQSVLRNDVTDTSGRQFWPQGPWLQPAGGL